MNPKAANGYKRNRNLSILLFVVIVIGGFFYNRQSSKEYIYVQPQETEFLVRSSQENEMSIPYSDIQSLSYVSDFEAGTMIDGTDDKHVRTGQWENSSLGSYISYCDKRADSAIVVQLEASTIVLSYQSSKITQSLFNAFVEYTEDKTSGDIPCYYDGELMTAGEQTTE